jgi:hypothetical protein
LPCVRRLLLRRGTPAQDALRFIGTLRENGWRSRFTLPASADIDILEGLAAVRGKPLTGSRLGGITAAN